MASKKTNGAGKKSSSKKATSKAATSKKAMKAPRVPSDLGALGIPPAAGAEIGDVSVEVAKPDAKRARRPASIPPPPTEPLVDTTEARRSKNERAFADSSSERIDDFCAAWAAIIAERMAADQTFAEVYEQYRARPDDLRIIFLRDQLYAAESHLSLVNATLGRHIDDKGRAEPFAILTDLRREQRKVAAVYAVNAFLAVLKQMSPNKPKWIGLDGDFNATIAVLALAHQTLHYALESARVEAPLDFTEEILQAAQDHTVWIFPHDEPGQTILAACRAAAVFFGLMGHEELSTGEVLASLYADRAKHLSKPADKATVSGEQP